MVNKASVTLMKIVGSVIARIGSKRLRYKNILPYQGKPLVVHALEKMVSSSIFDKVVLSTDDELIARTCSHLLGIHILRRPAELATDDTPSIPVFQHILKSFTGDIHLNYNCNFPECPVDVFTKAIELATEHGEALSVPYAAWAQTAQKLLNYPDPKIINAKTFDAPDIHPVDIHTMEDLLSVHQDNQGSIIW